MFTHNAGARGAVSHQHKIAELTGGSRIPQGQTA
jgi:hypothetical protein